MSDAVHRNVTVSDRSLRRRIAFGVFGAPAAWFLHEIASVALLGRNCAVDTLPGWKWWALATVSLAALATAAASGTAAWRAFAQHRTDGGVWHAEGWGLPEFLGLFGLFVSGLLLLNIVYFGVLPWVVEPCARSI